MEFKCANCLQVDKKPKLLSCFHVFCEGCLSQLVVSDQQGHFSLVCPICSMVTFMSPDKAHGLPTVETNFCLEHKSNDLSFYCTTCQELICVNCTTKSHSKHSYNSIADVFPAHKDEIEAKMRPLNDKLMSVSKALTRLGSQEAKIASKKQIMELGIHNMVGMIQEALQARQTELHDQLQVIVKENLEHVSSQKGELTIIQAQLSSCLGFIKESLRTSSKQEVMMMKSTLLKQVDILLDENRRFVSIEEFDVELSASPQTLIESCSQFGEIITSSNLDALSFAKHVVAAKKSPANPQLKKLLVQRLRTPILTLSGLKGPCGVAVNQNGEVVVAEMCADCISVFSQSGKKLRSFGKCGTGQGEFTCPCELDIDEEGNILVVDASNRRIQKFTSEGKFLAAIGSTGSGILQFLEPDGISINPVNKKIYVVDNNAHRVQVLNPDLTFCDMFGKKGNGKGYMHYPWGIACSCDGEVYVTDSGNCCVQVFTADGRYLREFGGRGNDKGEFKWPTGISVSTDGGIVYVSDYGNHRVSIFTSSGQFLHSFGAKGKRAEEFGNIRGVKVDGNGLVYVCDTDNNRVVLY